MIDRIRRAYAVFKLTKRFFRARQVPESCCVYYINGMPRTVYGEQALTMLIDIVINDSYGIRRLKALDTIVDIGANIGIFSLHASTCFPYAKVYAYEPCLLSTTNLEKNLVQLNAVVYPYAVGATTRKTQLSYYTDLSACSINSELEVSAINSQECEMLSFNDVTTQVESPISLLKLDCEGSEYEIMQTPAFEKVKYVVGELHTCQHGDPVFGIEILKQRGFNIDKWFPFPDGKAGVFWASNNREIVA